MWLEKLLTVHQETCCCLLRVQKPLFVEFKNCVQKKINLLFQSHGHVVETFYCHNQLVNFFICILLWSCASFLDSLKLLSNPVHHPAISFRDIPSMWLLHFHYSELLKPVCSSFRCQNLFIITRLTISLSLFLSDVHCSVVFLTIFSTFIISLMSHFTSCRVLIGQLLQLAYTFPLSLKDWLS